MFYYYGTVLSDHITKKPNGGIICTDVPIARTGAQEYLAPGDRQYRVRPRSNRCRLTCEVPGVIGNQYTGPILPITTIPGLSSAQITDILVADDVQAVRINGTLLISTLSHSSSGNVGTVGYTVLKIQVQEVTQIMARLDDTHVRVMIL